MVVYDIVIPTADSLVATISILQNQLSMGDLSWDSWLTKVVMGDQAPQMPSQQREDRPTDQKCLVTLQTVSHQWGYSMTPLYLHALSLHLYLFI